MADRVVVITGASGGIGAALARHLGGVGNAVVLAARRAEALERVAAESGAATLVVPTDVTLRSAVEHLRDEALGSFGKVDVWVNNAGRGINRPVLALSDDELDEMIAVNLRSVLYGMQAIVPHFIERGAGHLINISSFLGRVPLAAHRSAYNAAKAGVNALTANLRMDLRAYPGVHVSLVMPGIVLTDFARNVAGEPHVGPPPGAGARGPAAPQTAEEVAAGVAALIERPVPELYTNPASRAVAQRYYEDVAAFEAGWSGGPAQQGPPASPVSP